VCYLGDFSNGFREGFGRWFHLNGQFFSVGEWSNDAPNGQFSVQHGGSRSESVVNGLWHGDVVWDGFAMQFDMGHVVVIGPSWGEFFRVGTDVYGAGFDFDEGMVNNLHGILGFIAG